MQQSACLGVSEMNIDDVGTHLHVQSTKHRGPPSLQARPAWKSCTTRIKLSYFAHFWKREGQLSNVDLNNSIITTKET